MIQLHLDGVFQDTLTHAKRRIILIDSLCKADPDALQILAGLRLFHNKVVEYVNIQDSEKPS